jgi:hypothetical protein
MPDLQRLAFINSLSILKIADDAYALRHASLGRLFLKRYLCGILGNVSAFAIPFPLPSDQLDPWFIGLTVLSGGLNKGLLNKADPLQCNWSQGLRGVKLGPNGAIHDCSNC